MAATKAGQEKENKPRAAVTRRPQRLTQRLTERLNDQPHTNTRPAQTKKETSEKESSV